MQFDIPQAPQAFALEVTDRDAIIKAISDAAARNTWGTHSIPPEPKAADSNSSVQRWEYSAEVGLGDYMNTSGNPFAIAFIESALARWGRHGWELISVVPHQDRVIAFFKRPGK